MKVRYDFWSLIVALKSGLTHGGATPADRAKRVADDLLALEPDERSKRLSHLKTTCEFLEAIQGEIVCRQSNATCDTRVITEQLQTRLQKGS
jgi:hypothetical protein